ncbi:MAG: MBL fold metallo-hydrolase [Cyclobacteriaceae bacterium]
MMDIPDHIHSHNINLTETIPLNVYMVKGKDSSVFIDSGINSMHEDLMKLMDKANVKAEELSHVLNTHSHHDHIGGNAQLVEKTRCKIVAPETYAHWHHDWDAHYNEFARPFPYIFQDTQKLRDEVFGILDSPHRMDAFCKEGDVVDLGEDIQLECYAFSGHMMEEVGWLETKSNTLILGDVITLIDAPFIHGHLTVKGYQESLDKLERLIEGNGIKTILMSHFEPMTDLEAKELIQKARAYILEIEGVIIETLKSRDMELEPLWREVCDKLNKAHEFRSLSTVNAHILDLQEKNAIRIFDKKIVYNG